MYELNGTSATDDVLIRMVQSEVHGPRSSPRPAQPHRARCVPLLTPDLLHCSLQPMTTMFDIDIQRYEQDWLPSV